MTASLDISLQQHIAFRALSGYLRAVADELGVGLESVTVDHATPVSAYLALDIRLPRHPDRDVALLWDERHGWAIAIETHSSEDLIVLAYLGGPTITPAPGKVARFVDTVRSDDRAGRGTVPPAIRPAGSPDDLAAQLLAYLPAPSTVEPCL
ncbi:DUF6292 family protein [Amycolatopsis sp.]|uniref:DUF6292 family protein n=1 Tax=Amycolatopsis sp. TaxID=37632 RepID=UPI002C021DF2|nr:DUF6292 family protein [Amycolatopsis sp.]HVV08001.1 DUF6292 family protein [Amycolatopsis sp.]